MVEQTLVSVGTVLSDLYGIDRKKVLYEERDGLIRRLSEEKISAHLPVVGYNISDITQRSFRTGLGITSDTNVNNTITKLYKFIPVTLVINVIHMSSNYKDDIEFISKYFTLAILSSFTVDVKLPNTTNFPLDFSITEIQPLTTPPSMGREGFDYDKGKYYIKEGGFTVPSFVILTDECKLVRNITSNVIP